MRRLFYVLFFSLFIAALSASGSYAALTPGQTYTVEIAPVNTDGTIGSAIATTTATANSSGKVEFTVTGLPTSSTYKFFVITIKNLDGTTARRAIAPAAAAGSTTNLGVSPVTEGQAEALITALRNAGSDDPMVVLLGFSFIRSGGFSQADATALGNLAKAAILGSNGFNNALLELLSNDTAKLTAFKNAIQSRLGQYTAKLKDSVDNITDAAAAKNARAQGGALLTQLLMDAAEEAGFPSMYINMAFKGVGQEAESNMAGMSATARSTINSIMESMFNKIGAENLKKKYSIALTNLNATGDSVTKMNTAIENLNTRMTSAFQDFEALFQNESSMPTEAQITAAQDAINTVMQTAFNSFISDAESTTGQIDTMVGAMKTGFCPVPDPGNICNDTLNNMKGTGDYTNGMFAFRGSDNAAKRWPITMTVPVTWVVSNYAQTFTYTRDTLAVPAAMQWLDSDDWKVGGVPGANKKRHDWDDVDRNGVAGDQISMPGSLAALFGLREDIDIIKARLWAGQSAGSCDVNDSNDDDTTGAALASFDTTGVPGCDWDNLSAAEEKLLKRTMISRMTARKAAIGPAAITDAQRQALVDTGTMPDFSE